MDPISIAITGAFSQLGRLTVELVLARVPVSEVTLTTRRSEALSDFAEAFAGGERLLLISADVVGRRVAQHRAAIEAAREAGVRHVAYTSYLNPVEENPAVITPDHRDTEEALRESGLAWTELRNAFYAEYQVPAGAQAITTGRLVHNNGGAKPPTFRARTAPRRPRRSPHHRRPRGQGLRHRWGGTAQPERRGGAAERGIRTPGRGRGRRRRYVRRGPYRDRPARAARPRDCHVRGAIREGYIDGTSDAVENLIGRPPRSLREVFEAHRAELL